MNRTMKVAVALIVAAVSLSTMVYALPEQRAMAQQPNGAVTTPKIASGAVSMNTTQVLGSTTRVSTVPGTSDAFCPSGTVVTGGGYLASPNTAILINARLDPPANGWGIRAQSSDTNEAAFLPIASCATIHP
jgi:hypothetical protein